MSLIKSLKGLYKCWNGELIVKFIHWMYLDNEKLIGDTSIPGHYRHL